VGVGNLQPEDIFLARDSIYAIARSAIARPSVRLSGWISQRRLKLRSRNLHRRV